MKICKKIISVLLYSLMTLLVIGKFAVASTSNANCVTIKLTNNGAYVLKYKLMQSDSACGYEKSGHVVTPNSVTITASKGSFLKCHAEAGKTKYITLDKSGHIKASGQTLTNFKCDWT